MPKVSRKFTSKQGCLAALLSSEDVIPDGSTINRPVDCLPAVSAQLVEASFFWICSMMTCMTGCSGEFTGSLDR